MVYFFVFLAVLGLRWYMWAFSSCSEWAQIFSVRRLLMAGASLVAQRRLLGTRASVAVTHGSRVQTPWFWRTALTAPTRVGPSQTRN